MTGASSGIGAAAAGLFAAAGAVVVVHGRDAAAVERVAGRTGGVGVVADLTTEAGIAATVAAAGEVDALVLNAGVGWAGPLPAMTRDEVDRLVHTNLVAPIELTRRLLPAITARRGAVVFVTSIAGRAGVAREAVYAATKAGLDAFAESLRFEVAGTGVRVGVVVPGVVDTPFFARRGTPYARTRPKPVPAAAVARAIVTAVTSGKPERYVPRWLGVVTGVRGVLPGAYRSLATRFGGGDRGGGRREP